MGASFADPIGTWRVNLDGTLSVLEAARGLDAVPRVVTITSGEVYGQVPVDELPVRIDTPMNPDSPYGASKAAADLAATQYALSFDVPVLRVRAFNHIGPGQDAWFAPSIARQLALAEVRGDIAPRSSSVTFHPPRLHRRATWCGPTCASEAGDPSTLYLACSGASRPSSRCRAAGACSPLSITDAGRIHPANNPTLRVLTPSRPRVDPDDSIEQTLSDTLVCGGVSQPKEPEPTALITGITGQDGSYRGAAAREKRRDGVPRVD